jgi:hypothetical protein
MVKGETDFGTAVTVRGYTRYVKPFTRSIIFRDHFTGDNSQPPHRGKWFPFINKNDIIGVGYEEKIVEISEGLLHMKLSGDGQPNGGSMHLNCLSRAEFKVPFTLKFTVNISHSENQFPCHFIFAFVDPDPREGSLLGSQIYGSLISTIEAWSGNGGSGHWTLYGNDYSESHESPDNVWEAGTDYIVSFKMWISGGATKASLRITDSDGVEKWFIPSFTLGYPRCGYLRIDYLIYCGDQSCTGLAEFFVDEVKVTGAYSRRAKAVVTVKTGENIGVISDDVVDFSVSLREGSYPQATVTLKNEGNKYGSISVISEIEIRAGTDSVLWLLFRGYIEAPTLSFPPSLMIIESSKGYNKRLDFREAYNKTYSGQPSGNIVKDLIEEYFDDVFSTDNVADGETVSSTYNEASVAEILRELADTNGFVVYADFNRDIHFVDPSDEKSRSNITVRKAEDIIQVSRKQFDEIVNKVRQKGNANIVYTANNEESQNDYWLREKTFRDTSLTDAAGVQAKAQETLSDLKDPCEEVELSLPQIYPLEVYDLLVVECDEVGLDDEGEVKGVRYDFNANGVRTTVQLEHRGFNLSDALISIQKESKNAAGLAGEPPVTEGNFSQWTFKKFYEFPDNVRDVAGGANDDGFMGTEVMFTDWSFKLYLIPLVGDATILDNYGVGVGSYPGSYSIYRHYWIGAEGGGSGLEFDIWKDDVKLDTINGSAHDPEVEAIDYPTISPNGKYITFFARKNGRIKQIVLYEGSG